MPYFLPTTGTPVTPIGRQEFLRSTKTYATESYTIARSTVPDQTIDGNAGQKYLQSGTVMAKITSGADQGKIGPYSTDTANVTDGRSTPANIVGILSSYIPWQLRYGDAECSVVYRADVVQGWCREATAALPNGDVLSNATAAALSQGGAATKLCTFTFH